jgi:hypothetical protein
MAKETFLFRRTKMSERGKSNSISRSQTHTNRSTAEKQTSKNKNGMFNYSHESQITNYNARSSIRNNTHWHLDGGF